MGIPITITLGVGVIYLVVTSACFITNCPPGGKRSDASLSVRQCRSCGPPMLDGKCFGPQICCIPNVGCLVGTKDSLDCYKEDIITTPCYKSGPECTGNDKNFPIDGKCAADRVCCSTDTCTRDDSCEEEKPLQSQGEPLLTKHLLTKNSYRTLNHFLPPPYWIKKQTQHVNHVNKKNRSSRPDEEFEVLL